jgi:CRISPR/Cas system-associated endonuclease Cas3-HD
MKKLTMHEELEMLRQEVEQLRKDKELREEEEKIKLIEDKKKKELEVNKIKEKTQEIVGSINETKTDTKEAFNTLVDTVKKDYDNLSPTSAVLLFALGALFGSSLSSK